MESQGRDAALRRSVRERIRHGRLPLVRPEQVIAGYGSGRLCAACDRPITDAQTEYEVEDCASGSALCFHLACHGVWQLECAEASAGRGDSIDSSAA